MAKYSIQIKPSAQKELRSLEKKDRTILIEKIKKLTENPFPSQSQKLTSRNQYRLRSGKFRILYEIQKNILTITVVKVSHRKNAYQ